MDDDPPMMPNEEKLRGFMKVLEDEAPELLEKLIKVLYDPEVSKSLGKAVASFYKELKDAGMGDIPAARITAMYASNLSIRCMMRGMGPMGRPMMGPMGHGMHGQDPMHEGKW
jgi:hypothetical protein